MTSPYSTRIVYILQGKTDYHTWENIATTPDAKIAIQWHKSFDNEKLVSVRALHAMVFSNLNGPLPDETVYDQYRLFRVRRILSITDTGMP